MEHFAGIDVSSPCRGARAAMGIGGHRRAGTQQRVRGGWRRQDRARGKGGERAGGPWSGSSAGWRRGVTRIGLEAGPLSQWLHAGLVAAGFEVVLLETRHVKAALSAMVIKTDT